tara:strand:+ start:339 stop:650 length:312 start_codon:yes stop_codon:yes gene_type:complete
MTIVYTWKVNNLERDVADDYVTTVHYGVDAVDGEHSQGAYGTVSFDKATSPSSSSFGTLDEATVLSWVHAKVEPSKVEEALAERIALLANPVSAVGMPWAVAE